MSDPGYDLAPGYIFPEDSGPYGFTAGPVLDGIAAVTTRTGIVYPAEDVPASLRLLHRAPIDKPYFPRRAVRVQSVIDK